MNNDEPEKFTPKDYDSPKARHCEMLLSVEMDMTFVQGCCERILQDKKVELGDGKPRIGEDPTYTRALWDAALVALFKHGGETKETNESHIPLATVRYMQ